MIEWLEPSIDALRSPTCRLIRSGHYKNEGGVRGIYWICESRGTIFRFSVSNVGATEPDLHDLIKALENVHFIDGSKIGLYGNFRNEIGFYATVRSFWSFDGESHAYMLGRTNELDTIKRIVKWSMNDRGLLEVLNYIIQEELLVRRQAEAHRLFALDNRRAKQRKSRYTDLLPAWRNS